MTTTDNFVCEGTKQVTEAFQQAWKGAMKVQEELGRSFFDSSSRSLDQARVRFNQAVEDGLALQRRGAERFQTIVEDHVRRSADAWKELSEPAPTATDSANRWMSFWQRGFDNLRTTSNAVVAAQTEMFGAWVGSWQGQTAAASGKTAAKPAQR